MLEGIEYIGPRRIAIDGKCFIKCKFDRCSFTYSGGSFLFKDCIFLTDCHIEFIGSALGTFDLIKQLGFLNDSSISIPAGRVSAGHGDPS